MFSGAEPEFVDDSINSKTGVRLVRYCKSVRKYNQEDDVFQEAPIVTFVQVDSTFLAAVDDSSSQICQHICLTCFLNFNIKESSTVNSEEPSNKCGKCNWIFCSSDCMMDKLHAELECSVFRKNSILQQRDVYEFLGILRITQLKTAYRLHTQWSTIDNLSRHCKKRRSQNELLYERATKFLNQKCKIRIKMEIIIQLVNFLKSKSFQIFNSDSKGKRYFGAALYNFSSMIEHSCSSNCDWTILPNKNANEKWSIKIKAKRYIDAREKLTISLISLPNVLVGTEKRREILYKHYGFHCKCDLCKDPSEFDTNMSALMCLESTCDGFLLPVEINKNIHTQSSWRCHKCQKETPFEEINKIISNCESELTNIRERKTGTELVELLEDCITKWTGKVLYHNHYLLLQAEFYWARCASFDLSLDKSVGRLTASLVIERAVKFRKLLQHIVFGWNFTTAELDLLLGQAKLYLGMTEISPGDNQSERTRVAATRFIQMSLIYFHSSFATFNYLPSSCNNEGWSSVVQNWINVAKSTQAKIDETYKHRKVNLL